MTVSDWRPVTGRPCWFCRKECVDPKTYDSYPVDEGQGPEGEQNSWFAHIACIAQAHALLGSEKKGTGKQEGERG